MYWLYVVARLNEEQVQRLACLPYWWSRYVSNKDTYYVGTHLNEKQVHVQYVNRQSYGTVFDDRTIRLVIQTCYSNDMIIFVSWDTSEQGASSVSIRSSIQMDHIIFTEKSCVCRRIIELGPGLIFNRYQIMIQNSDLFVSWHMSERLGKSSDQYVNHTIGSKL